MKNLITNSRTRWLGMVICTCMLLLWNAHAYAENITSDGDVYLYFNMTSPYSWWNMGTNGSQNFTYFWGSSGNTWSIAAQQVDGDIYAIKVPSGTWSNLILVRNKDTSADWDNWNQSNDQDLSSSHNYLTEFHANDQSDSYKNSQWGDYIPTSNASLSATKTSMTTAQTSTLTASLSGNTTYNVLKSTSYSVTTNPGNAGSVTSGGVFSATAAGTYTVTATVTYNAKGFADITKTATATKSITVSAASTKSLTVTPGTGISAVTGSDDDISAGDNIAITATVADGYTWNRWTLTGSGTLSTFTATTKNQTVTVGTAGNMTLTASATEKMSTLTTSCSYSSGSPGYAVPTKSVSSIGIVTTSDLVATEPGSTYIFSGWTLTHCVRTSGAADSLSITVRSDGSGEAATAQANYTTKTVVRLYYNNPENWATVKAYVWESGNGDNHNASWPGVNITSNTIELNGDTYYYYEYYKEDHPNWNRVIFNNDGSSQTGNITFSNTTNNGQYNNATANESGSWNDLPAVETTYNVTCYAGAHGSITARSTNIAANGNATVQVGSVARTLTATPAPGYHFAGWTKTGNVTIADASSTPTTMTATGAGTVTATWEQNTPVRLYYTNPGGFSTPKAYFYSTTSGADSGWPGIAMTSITECGDTYYYVEYDKEEHPYWNKVIFNDNGNSETQTNDISFNNTTNNNQYNDAPASRGGDGSWSATAPQKWALAGSMNSWSTSANMFTCDDGTLTLEIALSANTDYNFKVVNVPENKWYGPSSNTEITYANKATAQSMSNTAGGAPNQTIMTAVAGTYRFTWNATDHSIKVTYPDSYKITFGMGTGGATISASGSTTGSITSGQYVAPGENVTFTQTNSTGYTFAGWYDAQTGGSAVSGMALNDAVLDNVRADKTVYSRYTENMTRVNLVASPTGKGTFSNGVSAVTSVDAGYVTHPSVTAVPATGYYINTSATVWSESSDYISISPNNAATTSITSTGASGQSATLTATFTPNTYRVQFHRNGASEATVYQNFTYDVAQNLTANSYTKTGYDFAGWAESASGEVVYGDGDEVNNLTSENGGIFHLYAKWTPKTTTITYSQSGTGYGSGGPSSTETATYDAAMPTPISLPTAADGYAFMGYYDALEPLGTQYYTSTGESARTWDKVVASATLYAYFKKAEITELTLSATIVAPSTDVTVTPTISPTPEGTTKICYEIQYNNGSALSPQPGMTRVGNTITFQAPEASATYKIQATLETGSTCGSGTELSTLVTTFQVAGAHDVTVRYRDASGRTLQASTTVVGRPLAWSNHITAPDITGYTFNYWLAGDGITLSTDSSTAVGNDTVYNATIYMKAIYDGTLTAVYNKKRMIYFNNTLGWEKVFVYFYKNDSYWHSTQGTGSNREWTWTDTPYSEGLHGEMQQIEGTTIYYFDAEAAGVPASYKDVVFIKAEQNSHDYFWQTEVVRRGDYNTALPMYVPLKRDPELYNSDQTTYYFKGYWMNYPENTGYTLKIYNKKEKANEEDSAPEELYSIPFEFPSDYKMPMELDVDLEAGRTYGFKIWRNDGENSGNGNYYGNDNTMQANTTNWDMKIDKKNCGLQTTAAGYYKFNLYYYDDNTDHDYQYRVGVTYPVAAGDYRIVYRDNATWSKGAHDASWKHPSGILTKNTSDTETKDDIVSFFVSYGSSPTLKYQSCSGTSVGSVSWSEETTIDLSAWMGTDKVIEASGVYNFTFRQSANGASISLVNVAPYEGNYYIRTDCAGSTKWSNFQTLDHQMTYSDYTAENEDYSHYFTHWVLQNTNIKFVIANDYSMCISDTLANDYGDNPIANIIAEGNDDAGKLLSDNANIRFMWNQSTNKISRAYIRGSSNIEDRFLVLEGGPKMYDEDGNELTGANRDHNKEGTQDIGADNHVLLHDDQNFIYERTIQVNTGAHAKLTAKYNENVQYFKGGEGNTAADSIQLLGGNADGKHKMRIVYDFKTNRLVTAYLPSTTTITDSLGIDADLMIIREHQEEGEQLTFSGSGKLAEVHTVYGVMRFNRWTLNNKSTADGHAPLGDPKSSYERGMYWISFPFDVNLSDVFGFGTYGVDWIIEYYDGEARAVEGYWADSEGFWKFVMPDQRAGYVLEAGKGYVLALDLDRMKDDNENFWTNNIEQIELFFPSADEVDNIKATNVKTTAEAHTCTIDRTGNGGADINKNRKVVDSNWNVIGVPSYATYKDKTLTSNGSDVITWHANDPAYTNPPYLYEWQMTDNRYTVKSGTTYEFKSLHSYMIQYGGDIYWSLASATPASVARRTYAEAPKNVEFLMELQQNGKFADQTIVKLSSNEEVSEKFVFNEDMSKEFNSRKANIYTIVENYIPTAGNTLPMSEQTTVVPVGVKIANTGDYTFAIPSGTSGVGVTLVDLESGERTNLALFDYNIHLEAGDYNERFVLEISPIQHTPTGVEDVQGDNVQGTKVRKVLIDNILYIIRDGKVFDAQGKRLH